MRANSYAEITEAAEQGINLAAERLGVKVADLRGYYLAGDEWDAETADELADEICRCWAEQQIGPDDAGLVCGCQVQRDHSGGQGHCWRDVTEHDLPSSVREEIEGEIIDGGRESCGRFVASNGCVYRW